MSRELSYIVLAIALLCSLPGTAQEGQKATVTIKDIVFKGLKKTKPYILLRELPFKIGDELSTAMLTEQVEEGRQRLLNVNLFNSVIGNINGWSDQNEVVISYEIEEQFFVTGYFIFDLADRNFNVWWEEQMRSLDRIDYGFRVSHENITGRADELSLGLTLGFTRRVDLKYINPGINRSRTLGLTTRIFYAENRETNFITTDNKFIFHRSDSFQLQRFKIETRWIYRPRLDYYHFLDVNIHQNKTSDNIAEELNADFFLEQKKRQRYWELGYSFIVDKRIQKPYTYKGWYARFNIVQSGIGIFKDRQQTYVRTTLAKYFSFWKKWSVEIFNRNQLFLSKTKQAYFNNRALGDRKDFLAGYELYALDGTDFTYLKTNLKYKWFDWKISVTGFKWLERANIIPVPLQVYITLNNDIGYVREEFYQEENPLANTTLWGGGVGLDLVVYYDRIFQVQYSINHLLEKGIFLHYKHKF